MAIILNGTTGITTPDIDSTAGFDGEDLTGDVAAARITGALNATGSAPIYACRAWVNFNGTSTVAIRASGNVSSITDNGTGDYTVNFTTAMPDANYSINVNARGNGDANRGGGGLVYLPNATLPTNSAVRFSAYVGASASGGGVIFDQDYIFVSIFR
jgi:hypothetical protein